jgi:hypothetical protein
VTIVIAIVTSILPVFLFLGALVLIDSYKLVALRAILLSVAAGIVAALAAYAVNVSLRPALGMDFGSYARYVSPLIEEPLKAAFVVYLLSRNKVGFIVDAAFLESLYYVRINPEAAIWSWVVRGFGTAIMHGGATAIVAMVSRAFANRYGSFRAWLVLPGLGVASVLHSLYNHFLLNPLLATGLIMLVLPWLSVAVFQQSERETLAWVGTGFDNDQELLAAVHAGQMAGTPAGKYITTLRSRFSAEVIVDMMCLLRIRAELAIRAKGVMMMREAGFGAPPDPTVKGKLEEMRYLEKNIGTTGLLALNPFLHHGTRDLWELQVLNG